MISKDQDIESLLQMDRLVDVWMDGRMIACGFTSTVFQPYLADWMLIIKGCV